MTTHVFKIVRADGKTKLITNVKDIEYTQTPGLIEVDVEVIDAGSNVQHDYFTEEVSLNSGDSAYLVNSHGCTIDVVRCK
jgi:hypothetical protein